MTNNISTDICLLAFDADDTLWDCQGHFDAVERAYCELLSPYGGADEISKRLFETETANMPDLGYGSKAFTISLVENAIRVSGGKATDDVLMRVLELGKSLLRLPATPLPGVEETLRNIRAEGRYKMVVFTKGDNLDQENKLRRSGLSQYFDDVVVVADKTRRQYERLCRLFDTNIEKMCMVGNSYKSDIKPVLDIGGRAVYVPYSLMWKYEAAEAVPHPRMTQIDSFADLAKLL